MIRSGTPDHTLALGGYWDYDSVIGYWLQPICDREPHSFHSSEEERV
jgi:hypothetical protein